MVYIIEFERPLGTSKQKAFFYVGYCEDGREEARLKEHRAGKGARITAAAIEQGIKFRILTTCPGDRTRERQIKKQKNTPKLVDRLRRQGLIDPAPFPRIPARRKTN
jgi:predicted GIY-YIG superfamily endonuclease